MGLARGGSRLAIYAVGLAPRTGDRHGWLRKDGGFAGCWGQPQTPTNGIGFCDQGTVSGSRRPPRFGRSVAASATATLGPQKATGFAPPCEFRTLLRPRRAHSEFAPQPVTDMVPWQRLRTFQSAAKGPRLEVVDGQWTIQNPEKRLENQNNHRFLGNKKQFLWLASAAGPPTHTAAVRSFCSS